ncbi:cystathionine gamma-lyase [Mesorhizobium sp. LHD-90]|uniref:cystathionine gamma-lyase n=1 Tax=Mesorhizobium sp. LHD-90 TaxID=3071414 RepID=UPI0027DF687A|nr:cystathionine gamma-lyase [Mesorhizobium sp. LHD-90]MDQ6433457.1 cystathionine gamma-lyase [Mesorhizobium sp. LHD-90]
MTDTPTSRAASLQHLRRQKLMKGEPVALPLTLASTYHLPGDPKDFNQYGRFDNATWEAAEEMLSHLEGAPCLAFPSGMAAISAVFFGLLKSGDRILLPSDGYYTTRVLSERFLSRFGVSFDLGPTASFLDGGFDGYRLVFVETPANPGLELCDIAAVARAAHAAGALVVADNTTMTPFGQRPLDLGADILVAADTKAPNGHSDTLFGHVATRDTEIFESVRRWRELSGSIPGPFEAWLLHRGLETLELRFDRMCSSAGVLAARLKRHKAVEAVRYPGLPDHPSHNLASTQMLRFGSLIGLTLKSAETAEAFIDGCELLQPATSFGSVHSSAERRARWGDAVAPGFIRLSVGCEPTEDLWQAIDRSLSATDR